jgi:hypothetical protein
MKAMGEFKFFVGVGNWAFLGLCLPLCLFAAGCGEDMNSHDVAPVAGEGDDDGDRDEDMDEVATEPAGATSTAAPGVPAPDSCPGHWENTGGVPSASFWTVADDAGMGSQFGKTQGNEERGYVEQEFFFTGTQPGYTTRMVVNRPEDMSRFSGTVFVEWYNVSGGMDVPPLWYLSRDYFAREGHVHVGVSAQQIGSLFLTLFDGMR